MSIEQMRKAIKGVYYGDAWKAKVEKMSDSQVYAVYNRFQLDGKFKQHSFK